MKMPEFLKKLMPKYRLSAMDRRDADSAAVLAMIDTLVTLQVRTTYGLKHEGVAALFDERAARLSASAQTDGISRKDRAMLLHMSGIMSEKSKELRFEGVKSASKNKK